MKTDIESVNKSHAKYVDGENSVKVSREKFYSLFPTFTLTGNPMEVYHPNNPYRVKIQDPSTGKILSDEEFKSFAETVQGHDKLIDDLQEVVDKARDEFYEDLLYLFWTLQEIIIKVVAIYGYWFCSKKARWIVLLSPVVKLIGCLIALAAGHQIPYFGYNLRVYSALYGPISPAMIICCSFMLIALDNAAVIMASKLDPVTVDTGVGDDFLEQLTKALPEDAAKKGTGGGGAYATFFLYSGACVYYYSLVCLVWKDTKSRGDGTDVSEIDHTTREPSRRSNSKSVFGLFSSGNFEGLKKMLMANKNKIAINVRDSKGDTLLHKLCQSGPRDILVQVLETFPKKINFGAKNHKQMTPLETAVNHDQLEAVNALLACKELPKVDKTVLTMSLNSSVAITKSVYNGFTKHDKLSPKLDSVMNMYLDLNKDQASEEKIVKYRRLLIREIPSSSSFVSGSMKKKIANNETGDGQATKVSKSTDQEILNDFKCTQCSKIMKTPLKIFACSNDHYICSGCVDQTAAATFCADCGENFYTAPPQRRIGAEKIIESLI